MQRRNETYRQLIAKYGEKQIVVAIEELSELQKELCKALRGTPNKEHITEELADVLTMVDQMAIYYGISYTEIMEMRKEKLERTRYREKLWKE